MTRRYRAADGSESWLVLRGVLVLFGLLLLSNVALATWSLYGDASPWAEVAMVVFDAVVVGGFALAIRGSLAPLLQVRTVGVRGWAWTGGLFAALYLFMWGYMALAVLMFDEIRMLADYREHGWPLWSALVLIAITPPLIEELAFRGYIFDRLTRIMPARDANILQAALFSILHCSVPILPSHFVMGLAFGWLRLRTKSLIPGIVLHAAWNAAVVLEELARDG